MFGLGTQELLIILVLVMIIFGAGKLPQVGSALGKGLRNFKKGMNDGEEEIEEGEIEEIAAKKKQEIKEEKEQQDKKES
jgi:sec-independent protein translocase protein TatA